MSRSSRTVWSGAIRSAKRWTASSCRRVGALLAGKYESRRIAAADRFQHPARIVADGILRGRPARRSAMPSNGSRARRSSSARRRSSSATGSACRTAASFRARSFRCWRRSRSCKVACCATPPSVVTFGGLCILALLMLVLWRRCLGRRARRGPGRPGGRRPKLGAMLLQAKFAIVLDTSLWHVAIAAYLAAIALDEIDFRSLLGGIAERRFQRIAMSLGDGLVCADQNGRITVWNPGAVAIFGYQPDEMIGQPLDRICALGAGDGQRSVPLSASVLSSSGLQSPGGKVMELEGRRKNGETFPLEACFSAWQGVDGIQYGAVMRDISVRKREAERIRYLAEHDTLTGLANRNSLYEQLRAWLAGSRRRSSARSPCWCWTSTSSSRSTTRSATRCGDQLALRRRGTAARLAGGAGLVARLERRRVRHRHQRRRRGGARARRWPSGWRCVFSKSPIVIGDRHVRVNVSIGVAIYPDHCAHRRRAPRQRRPRALSGQGCGPRPARLLRARDPRRARGAAVARGRTADGPPSAKNSNCSISRRSISRTAGWWAPRP